MNFLRTKVFVVLIAGLVAGCVMTVQDVLNDEAEFVLHTKSPLEKAESCVIRSFSDVHIQLSRLRHPTADGWIIASHTVGVDFLIEVIRSDDGTKIIYRLGSFGSRTFVLSSAETERRLRKC